MTGPAPLLDFFVLEAGEYLEQLDALLAAGQRTSDPDAAALQRLARALRGSATMAKLGAFADVASGLERLGRGLQDGAIAWDAEIGAVLIAAIDDLKLLVHSARDWTAADTTRAKARATELQRYAPSPASSAPTPVVAGGLVFLASEATNIAAGIELLASRPNDRGAAAQVLGRVRAFRGVAGIADVSGLADVLDAVDEVVRGVESGAGPLAPTGNAVLRSAMALLRRIAAESREGKAADLQGPERLAFAEAVERWYEQGTDAPVIPISELFFDDVGPHVVASAASPPIAAQDRFYLELVSFGEHLRGLLTTAQSAAADSPTRLRRECRRALRSVAGVAGSFGDRESADWFDAAAARLAGNETIDLSALQAIADTLTGAKMQGDPLIARLKGVPARDDREMGTVATPPTPPTLPTLPTPPVQPQPPRHQANTPIDPFLQLDAGIAAIAMLTEHPLAAPVSIPGAEIVAIESLLYRGRGALNRAIEVRDELRREGQSAPPEVLQELFDLLDLAVAD